MILGSHNYFRNSFRFMVDNSTERIIYVIAQFYFSANIWHAFIRRFCSLDLWLGLQLDPACCPIG